MNQSQGTLAGAGIRWGVLSLTMEPPKVQTGTLKMTCSLLLFSKQLVNQNVNIKESMLFFTLLVSAWWHSQALYYMYIKLSEEMPKASGIKWPWWLPKGKYFISSYFICSPNHSFFTRTFFYIFFSEWFIFSHISHFHIARGSRIAIVGVNIHRILWRGAHKGRSYYRFWITHISTIHSAITWPGRDDGL